MAFDQRGFYEVLGGILRGFRVRAGMTQEEVATELGITRASYASIESGRQRAPADVIWRLSIVYGAPVARLLPEPKVRVHEGSIEAYSASPGEVVRVVPTSATRTFRLGGDMYAGRTPGGTLESE